MLLLSILLGMCRQSWISSQLKNDHHIYQKWRLKKTPKNLTTEKRNFTARKRKNAHSASSLCRACSYNIKLSISAILSLGLYYALAQYSGWLHEEPIQLKMGQLIDWAINDLFIFEPTKRIWPRFINSLGSTLVF